MRSVSTLPSLNHSGADSTGIIYNPRWSAPVLFFVVLDNLKVYGASVLGFGSPIANIFIDTTTSVLGVLVLVGQIAVAAVTTLYIFRKAQALHRDKKNSKKD